MYLSIYLFVDQSAYLSIHPCTASPMPAGVYVRVHDFVFIYIYICMCVCVSVYVHVGVMCECEHIYTFS